MQTLATTVPADSFAPFTARATVAGFLACVDKLPTTFVTDAVLLTSELITNSVLHSGLGQEELIAVELSLNDDELRVVVSDADADFDPESIQPIGEGGWGLRLVADVADRWGIVRGKPNRVWFELDR